MALPAGSLAATLDVYNRHAERGEDPLFHKGTAWVRPLAPPLGEVEAPCELDGALAGLGTGIAEERLVRERRRAQPLR